MQDDNHLNPLQAIKAHCLDCMCGNRNEAVQCPCDKCPLYPFRLGKNPYRKKKELTKEQIAARVANLKRYKDNKSNNQSV